VVTNYTYDAIGRLLTRTHFYSLFALNVNYDDDTRTITAANGFGTLIWNFDPQGRPTSEHSLKNSSTVSYQYNADDQRILMGINTAGQPIGSQYSYTGGLLDAIARTGSTGPTRTWTFGYHDLGTRTSMSLPNNDLFVRSEQSVVEGSEDPERADVVRSAAYTHDDVGNRLAKALLEGTET
jgi:YD repeat-containing protein